jgi:hypothetical protein
MVRRWLGDPRHSLGGTNRLGENPFAQLRFHRVPHDQVDPSAKDFFQSWRPSPPLAGE